MSKPEELIYKEKIETLRAEYNVILSKISKIKDMTLFDSEMRRANIKLGKINDLKIKLRNIKSGNPPNGNSDWFDGYKIIE